MASVFFFGGGVDICDIYYCVVLRSIIIILCDI